MSKMLSSCQIQVVTEKILYELAKDAIIQTLWCLAVQINLSTDIYWLPIIPKPLDQHYGRYGIITAMIF